MGPQQNLALHSQHLLSQQQLLPPQQMLPQQMLPQLQPPPPQLGPLGLPGPAPGLQGRPRTGPLHQDIYQGSLPPDPSLLYNPYYRR